MQDRRPDPTLELDYCGQRPIFIDFLQHAQQSPDAMAVVSPQAGCSYGQLEAISHRIASFLLGQGASQSDRVVIVSTRCAGLVYAMLGAGRAGLPFTVADVAFPPARLDQIMRALQPSWVLLCGGATVELAPGRGDSQVKTRGHRIELTEIELALPANQAPRCICHCASSFFAGKPGSYGVPNMTVQ